VIAALISVHGDDRGLVLPWSVAPVQVVIVPILFKD
jgi:prolyl-tRNA synthetase